jgi:hypothetical protein
MARVGQESRYEFFIDHMGERFVDCELQCEQCKATGRYGRCKRNTCVGSPFCWAHLRKLAHLRVKDSPGAGKGLFAVWPRGQARPPDNVVFKKGARICPYSGEDITEDERRRRYFTGEENQDVYTLSEGHKVTDLSCKRGVGAMANTVTGKKKMAKLRGVKDKQPYVGSVQRGTNAKLVLQHRPLEWAGLQYPARTYWLMATRDIKVDEEIKAHYGDGYRIYLNPDYVNYGTRRVRTGTLRRREERRRGEEEAGRTAPAGRSKRTTGRSRSTTTAPARRSGGRSKRSRGGKKTTGGRAKRRKTTAPARGARG